ncbi:hypothetical protein F183_A04690 [Bryobacterales bacterium F-183]|nr:hypothetical protein F183_A04690 [Bryobacterales bacterium F-183]
MKKKATVVEIKTDSGKKARTQARATVGIVKPSRPLEERQAPERKPKHKKPIVPDEE